MTEDTQIGARIRDIRSRVGMAAQDLANSVGLDPSAISNIERGKRSIKSDELAAIARALGVSPLAILEQDSLLGRLPVAPRSPSGTLTRGTVLNRLTGLAELHQVLADLDLSSDNLRYQFPDVDTSSWLSSAPELAEWARSKVGKLAKGDKRFESLVEKIESTFKVDVLVESQGEGESLGASVTDPEFSLIFVNMDQPISRALFTLTHELGHVLAQNGGFVVDDDLNAHASHEEQFANAFSAAFLLPEKEIRKRVASGGLVAATLCSILDDYGTSFETLVYRLHNLRIINAVGRNKLRSLGLRQLLAQVSDQSLGARLLARLATRPSRHSPTLLSERAIMGYRNGIISARPVASVLDVPVEDVVAGMELDAAAALEDAVSTSPDSDVMDSDFTAYSGSPVE